MKLFTKGAVAVLFAAAVTAATAAPNDYRHPGAGLLPAERLADWRPGVAVGVPASELLKGVKLPASLYRAEKAAWFGALKWPAFGPDTDFEQNKIPAQVRFEKMRAAQAGSPYPPSPVFEGITWHWDTHRTAAPGSDLWPVTWGADGNLYTAWGDGGGFGGTDSDGRVAMGFARIEGEPESMKPANINGGKEPEHPASFLKSGKTGGILSLGRVLYAWINRQNGKWPDVDEGLAWSEDLGATWTNSAWVFPKGDGNYKPSTFLQFGRGGAGVPAGLKGFVYLYGTRQGNRSDTFLGRVPEERIRDRAAYEFFCGMGAGRPIWTKDPSRMRPVFHDPHGANDLTSVVYSPALKRYLAAGYHSGPGQLGVFDAPEPWGPWTTVAYYEDWGRMGAAGEGLTCSFPAKWMSPDGLNLWCVFSVYGDGAKQGINAHDRFNLVKATLRLRGK